MASPIRVFRGQLMCNEELMLLHRSIGEVISMNSFLSTTSNQENAIFLLDTSANNTIQRVLFDIYADPNIVNNKPFADISVHSYFPNEKEVLFMAGSIFRLVEIQRQENGINRVCLALCSSEDHDLKDLFTYAKDDIGEVRDLHKLGYLTWRSGKLNAAEKCFRQRLKEVPSDSLFAADCYHSLGNCLRDRCDYDESLLMFNKALEIKQDNFPPNHPNIGLTFNSMGLLHWRKNDMQRALLSFDKALLIFQQAYGDEHRSVAWCWNNKGVIYRDIKNYEEALRCYQQALNIYKKILPAYHSHSGASHNNIGITYTARQQFDLALEHFETALKIKLKSLPSDHSDIGDTYRSMGYAHEGQNDFRKALSLYEKSSVIRTKVFPTTHPDVIQIMEDIERAQARLNQNA